jgi:hypothetical protein
MALAMLLLIAAAHQGEEFVIALPLAMLGAAYFILKWASGGDQNPPEDPDA